VGRKWDFLIVRETANRVGKPQSIRPGEGTRRWGGWGKSSREYFPAIHSKPRGEINLEDLTKVVGV